MIVCSLALSIGASTALFSVVDAVLLRTLPVRDPERLALIKLGGWGDSTPYAVRMAIGADAGPIQWGVVRDGVVLYAAGAVLGIPLALAATRYFRSLLFGIEPVDWRVAIAVALLLGTTAALAAYVPARRASRVDPMQVLRTE